MIEKKKFFMQEDLNDEPTTLEDLSKKYKISRERVRQIENKAFEKFKNICLTLQNQKIYFQQIKLLNGSSIKI